MKSTIAGLAVLAILFTGCATAAPGAATQAAVTPALPTPTPTPTATPTPTPAPTPTPTATPTATPIAYLGCTLDWTFVDDGAIVPVDFPSASQATCDGMIPGSAAIAVSRSEDGAAGTEACRGTWAEETIVVYEGEATATEALCNVVHPRVAYTIKGTQTHGNTKKFTLRAGSYKVTITGKARHEAYGFGGGNVIVYLSDAEGQDLTFNEIVGDGKSYKFTTHEFDLVGEAYYLDVTMPSGSWSVTFTPED